MGRSDFVFCVELLRLFVVAVPSPRHRFVSFSDFLAPVCNATVFVLVRSNQRILCAKNTRNNLQPLGRPSRRRLGVHPPSQHKSTVRAHFNVLRCKCPSLQGDLRCNATSRSKTCPFGDRVAARRSLRRGGGGLSCWFGCLRAAQRETEEKSGALWKPPSRRRGRGTGRQQC